MAEQFIGMTISLTLSNNAQLQGTVSKVDSTTQILHLRDGRVPGWKRADASLLSSERRHDTQL
jgi:hypothetical protein